MHMYKPIIFSYFTELKLRFFYVCLSFIINFLVCYTYCFQIVYIFTKPFLVYKKNFIFTNITEFFYTNIQICFFFAMYLILPLLLYHIWCFFVTSVLSKDRYKNSIRICICILFVYSALLFVYKFVVPKIFYFLVHFMIDNNLLHIDLQLRIKSYVYMCITMYFLSSFFSVLLFLFFFVIKKNKTILKTMCQNRIRNFLCILILASVIAPPNIIFQICVSICLFVFYEIFLLTGYIYTEYT